MNDIHRLTRHRDIQSWVSDRKGVPAIKRVPDALGTVRARLEIRFARAKGPPAPLDESVSPVSWSAWLAEFDRQGLVLKVDGQKHFEFVERTALQ
jgi:hypothetical protein